MNMHKLMITHHLNYSPLLLTYKLFSHVFSIPDSQFIILVGKVNCMPYCFINSTDECLLNCVK